MPTIILTSSGNIIGNSEIGKYLPRPLSECKILYITTAINKSEDIHHVIETREIFKEMGLNYTEYDIEEKIEEELRDALQDIDILYMEGGNTFYLIKAIRETDFEKLIKEAIEREVVYWGASAGTYVACPSIIVSSWSVDRKTHGVTDFTGMNLVPYVIKAHYTPEMADTVLEKSKVLEYPLRILTDDQAIVVKDGEEYFLGGEEMAIE